jgi:transcriptional regulator with XRE-family HTH domain
MATLGDIIRDARERLGISQAELARRLKVSRAIVSKWEKDEAAPKRSRAAIVARVLQIPIGAVDPLSNPTVSQVDTRSAQREIYLMKWDELAQMADGHAPSNAGRVTVLAGKHLSDDAVGLIVHDDSMSPAYAPGELIIVSSKEAPQDGDDVVAVLKTGETLLRSYRSRGVDRNGTPAFDLLAHNPDYPTITINYQNRARALYVVVEHHRQRRSLPMSAGR